MRPDPAPTSGRALGRTRDPAPDGHPGAHGATSESYAAANPDQE